MVRLDHAPNSWYDMLDYLMKRPINKPIWSILLRLLLDASVHILWQERNLRTFQNKRRTLEEGCNLIKDVVRLRVKCLSLNTSAQILEAADIWDFHTCSRKMVIWMGWKFDIFTTYYKTVKIELQTIISGLSIGALKGLLGSIPDNAFQKMFAGKDWNVDHRAASDQQNKKSPILKTAVVYSGFLGDIN
ncbi:hypothetical protein CTI12_AA257860 [Artemisia annua]|uniref:Reverse transcriptase domain, Reverse transcriptase zinc-binding domain protein n=1 Tax=Artemisia annua TaxID=35608 RepID=A0A2U1NK34_ARTAN|nr:hypothetical protein CTI12_AA257860 [Artemisia annua]